MSNKRFDELMGCLIDGEVSEEQLDELVALASADLSLLRELRDQLQLSDRLSQCEDPERRLESFQNAMDTRIEAEYDQGRFVRQVVLRALETLKSRPAGSGYRFRSGIAGIAAAAVILLGLGLFRLFSGSQNPEFVETMDDSVAVLSRSVNVDWGSGRVYPVGHYFSPGTLSIAKGIVGLEFYSGASLIVEGPAEIEILDSETAVCRRGKISATVPAPAQGFTMLTPKVELVDLGTAFALNVRESGETSVHVFQGKVELYDMDTGRNPDSRRELSAGAAIDIGEDGQWHPLALDQRGFVSEDELDGLESAANQARYREWKQFSEALSLEGRVAVYYSFEQGAASGRTLGSQLAHSRELDGAIIGCAWATGRWPGKGALEFKKISDRVRFSLPGTLESITLAAWVRVDGLDRLHNSLMLSDKTYPGRLHWQISHDGRLDLGVRGVGTGHGYTSPPIIDVKTLGKWLHMVTVYDGQHGMVRHFLNGAVRYEERVENPTPLNIGTAEIGNWARPPEQEGTIRNFNGRMDEFMILTQALSEEEVRALYETGQP